ncbi:MAG: hypothetical protein K2K84_04145 [Muribaculaceae bacterium]|nr:hypothetical protein [Muribaculaceae bacterium]
MDDDFNTPIVIANLFEAARLVNMINDGKATATAGQIDTLKTIFNTFLVDILGIRVQADAASASGESDTKPYHDAIDLLLEMRRQAKADKNWALADQIRDRLTEFGFQVKDTKDGFEWSLKQ